MIDMKISFFGNKGYTESRYGDFLKIGGKFFVERVSPNKEIPCNMVTQSLNMVIFLKKEEKFLWNGYHSKRKFHVDHTEKGSFENSLD